MKNNKIAIVHDFLLKLGGAENLLLNILSIYPNADIYTLLYDEIGTKNKFKKYSVTPSILQKNPKKAPNSFKLLLPKFPKAIESFNLSDYDLVISISNSFAHGVITSPQTLHVCYLLSPTRYLYDWKNEYLAENGLEKGFKSVVVKKLLSDLRIWDLETRDRPDKYIAISNWVCKRLRKYYRLNADVVFPPVDVEKITTNNQAGEDYYIIVSRLTPYKKVDLAVEAFNKNKKNLIIIGSGEDEKRLKSLAKANIEFMGWQSDSSMYEYLRNAKALIFPGEEDFGLTPIEAMACGRPVIAYNKGGVVETVRDGIDGVYFNDSTPESLNDSINKFEKMDFDHIKIRKHAEVFSLANFTDKFTKLIDEYAKEHKNSRD